MWILLLEAGIALALLVFIVWWTMAPVKRREGPESGAAGEATPTRAATPDADGKEGASASARRP